LNLYVGTSNDNHSNLQYKNILNTKSTPKRDNRSVNSKNISEKIKKNLQKENAIINTSIESEMTS
jgi:hypothetical protein